MPILSLMDAKALLQIAPTDTGQDPLIVNLIRRAEVRVTSYCNTRFASPRIQIVSDKISFAHSTESPASNPLITDANAGFVDAGFVAGMDVSVRGSNLNDGIKSLKAVSASTLTLISDCELFDEEAGSGVVITLVEWPADLGVPTAALIGYWMEKAGKLVSQETLPGGYTGMYRTEDDILKRLNHHRRPM